MFSLAVCTLNLGKKVLLLSNLVSLQMWISIYDSYPRSQTKVRFRGQHWKNLFVSLLLSVIDAMLKRVLTTPRMCSGLNVCLACSCFFFWTPIIVFGLDFRQYIIQGFWCVFLEVMKCLVIISYLTFKAMQTKVALLSAKPLDQLFSGSAFVHCSASVLFLFKTF